MDALAQLFDSFIQVQPIVREIEHRVLSNRVPRSVFMSEKQAEYDQAKAYIYFRLYIIPMLECAGLLTANRVDTAVLWGKVQFSMGMHIRYLDKVIDADTQRNHYHDVQLAHYYLLSALNTIGTVGQVWNTQAQAIYCQYLHYESEIRVGYRHSFASLWRRVSPLCVVPEQYLAERVAPLDAYWFRHYLSWSLVYADCADVFDDMQNHTTTPISRLLREAWTNTYHDAQIAVDVIGYMQDYLETQCHPLLAFIQPRYPLWSMCVAHMKRIHGDPLLRRYS